jgi:hypothetical protein
LEWLSRADSVSGGGVAERRLPRPLPASASAIRGSAIGAAASDDSEAARAADAAARAELSASKRSPFSPDRLTLLRRVLSAFATAIGGDAAAAIDPLARDRRPSAALPPAMLLAGGGAGAGAGAGAAGSVPQWVDGWLCRSAMAGLAALGDWAAVRALLNLTIARFGTDSAMPPATYVLLIQTAHRAGDRQAVEEVFEHFVRWIQSLRDAQAAAASAAAQSAVDSPPSGTAALPVSTRDLRAVCHAYMDAIADARNGLFAMWTFLDTMRHPPLSLEADQVSYSIATKALMRKGRLDVSAAEGIAKVMREHGLTPTQHWFNTVLLALSRAHRKALHTTRRPPIRPAAASSQADGARVQTSSESKSGAAPSPSPTASVPVPVLMDDNGILIAAGAEPAPVPSVEQTGPAADSSPASPDELLSALVQWLQRMREAGYRPDAYTFAAVLPAVACAVDTDPAYSRLADQLQAEMIREYGRDRLVSDRQLLGPLLEAHASRLNDAGEAAMLELWRVHVVPAAANDPLTVRPIRKHDRDRDRDRDHDRDPDRDLDAQRKRLPARPFWASIIGHYDGGRTDGAAACRCTRRQSPVAVLSGRLGSRCLRLDR